MDELVVVEVVANEPEAELLCGLLRAAGIRCSHQLTDRGAGASDGISFGGPRGITVRREDAESAREILRQN